MTVKHTHYLVRTLHYNSELVSWGRIETLSLRREKLTLSFAQKASSNVRFTKWFPKKEYNGLDLRREKNL